MSDLPYQKFSLLRGPTPPTGPVGETVLSTDVNGNLLVSIDGGAPMSIQAIAFGTQAVLPVGSPAAPGVSFAGDLSTGWIYAGQGDWAFYSLDTLQGRLRQDGGLTWLNRVQQSRGGSVASASTIAALSANYFHVTGTTTINLMDSTNWQDGAEVEIYFEGSLTITNNAAPSAPNLPFLSVGESANITVTAKQVHRFRLDSALSAWKQIV
jgi:hypothetical protein